MGDNAMYHVGDKKWTQSQLNNSGYGTDANAIYYATHGGNSGANYVTGANTPANNSGSYVDFGDRGSLNDTIKGLTGGGGNGGGSSSSSGGYDMNSYLADLYAQRQAAAEAAYEKSMGYLNDAYNSAVDNYGNIYNRGRDNLEGAYNNSRNKINEQATDSMREAYINKMLSMKNLSQKLAAMGISGGASESTVAGLLNNYGNARNGIQKTWNTNLSDLEQGYNANLADLYNTYQSQLAALANNRAAQQAQLISNLNNQIADVQGDFFSALAANPGLISDKAKSALANVQGIEPVATEATNTYNPVSAQQANDMGTRLTNWWDFLQSQDVAGVNANKIASRLQDKGATDEELAYLMNKYYI